MSKQAFTFYEFGPFRLDAGQRILLRDEKLVPLTPKLIDTLIILVESKGRVMEKAELMEKLWPDTFVEESSLSQNISLLRKTLGNGSSENQYIETVPKRGYRFIAEVREVGDEKIEEAQDSKVSEEPYAAAGTGKEKQAHPDRAGGEHRVAVPKRWVRGKRGLLLLICVALIIGGAMAFLWYKRAHPRVDPIPKSIAVLPFKSVGIQQPDTSTNAQQSELLGLGIADAIILKLSELKEPRVLPTSSVFKLYNQDYDTMVVGRQLGVDAILEGTVQQSRGLIRVTARLINISDGQTLWIGKFDEPYTNIFVLQDSIANKLAQTIYINFTEDARARMGKRFTQNVDAYQDYLEGIYFWNKRNKTAIEKAIYYFQQAIQKDPSFALAYALLSDCYGLILFNSYDIMPVEEAVRLRDEAAKKALELDKDLSEAHLAIVQLKIRERDYRGARQEFQHAIRLNPNNANAHAKYAYFLFQATQIQHALIEARAARDLDPVSPSTNSVLCFMLIFNRQYDEALKYGLKSVELEPDAAPFVRETLGFAFMQKGMYNEAIAQFSLMKDSLPLDSSLAIAHAYAASGRREEAEKLLSQVLQSKEQKTFNKYRLAKVYLALGDNAKALEWLEQLEIDSPTASWLKYDPQLDSLRSDKAFADLIRRRGQTHILHSNE